MQTLFNKAGKAGTKDNTPKGFWRKTNLLSSIVVLLLGVAPVEGGSYSSHFVVNDSTGTVYDTVEDLTWMKCELGKSGNNCSGTGVTKTWQEATDYCNNLSYGGKSNWRLPTVFELKTIGNKLATTVPYTFSDVFPNMTAWLFWTSAESSDNALRASFISFIVAGIAGDSFVKDSPFYVRCVSPGA